ncbi:hypothetical protein [Streptomyces sp. NPDC000878]
MLTEIVIATVVALLTNEFCDVSPWIAKRLVGWAARRSYRDPARAEVRAEEWAALIDERPGKLFKLFTATGFFLGALAASTKRSTTRRALEALLGAGDIAAALASRLGHRNVRLYEVLLQLGTRLGSKDARVLLAQFQEMDGRLEEAIQTYKGALGHGTAWVRLTGLLEMHGEIDEAIRVYTGALELYEDRWLAEEIPVNALSELLIPYRYARAELVRLLQAQGRVDSVLALHQDRFTAHSPEERARLADLERLQVTPEYLLHSDCELMPDVGQPAHRFRDKGWTARLLLSGMLELEGWVDESIAVCKAATGKDHYAEWRIEALLERYGPTMHTEPHRLEHILSAVLQANRHPALVMAGSAEPLQ